MSNNQGSDLGFIVFLGIAALFIIPLIVGVETFDDIFRIGKIVLIIISIIAIIAVITIGILFYRRKFPRKKITKTEEENKQIEYTNLDENKQKKLFEINDEQLFKNNDFRGKGLITEDELNDQHKKENNLLLETNQKFDL